MSTCVKCGGHFFKIEENSPASSNYKVWFIQCSKCGTPVGVMDYISVGNSVTIIQNKIDHLEKKINNLDHSLGVISAQIEQLSRR